MKQVYRLSILTFFILLVVGFHKFGYTGHFGYDDMNYAKLSAGVLNGYFDSNNPFFFRWPIIFLTALSYKFFGICDFASSLPSILTTIGVILIVYRFAKKESYTFLISALAFTVLSEWMLFYSDKLMADVYVTLSVSLIVFIIYQYKFGAKAFKPWFYALFLALFIFFGIISKESIVLIFPLLGYLSIRDFLLKRDRAFWVYSGLFSLALLVLYLGYFKIWFGDPFFRFKSIYANSYLNPCSYDQQPVSIVLKRVFYELFGMFITSGMAIPLILALSWLAGSNRKKVFTFEDKESFLRLSTFILVLSANFMSVSIKSYNPLCIDPRHYLFIIPIASVAAAFTLQDFLGNSANLKYLLISLFLLCIVSYKMPGDNFFRLYLPFLMLVGGWIILNRFNINPKVFLLLFIIILCIKPLYFISYAQNLNYSGQMQTVKKQLDLCQKPTYVVTDPVQKLLGEYYYGFDKRSDIRFLNFEEFNDTVIDSKQSKVLLLNWYTNYLSGQNETDLPDYAKYIRSENKPLYIDETLHIKIYQLNNINKIEPLISSFNDFEKPIENWEIKKEELFNTEKFEGNNSLKLSEYSGSYNLLMDTVLNDSKTKQIIIKTNLMCWSKERSDIKIVTSVEDSNGNYIWDGTGVDKYLKTCGKWWPAKSELVIKPNTLRKGSRLKVYVWNPKKTEAYIDNFSVSISTF